MKLRSCWKFAEFDTQHVNNAQQAYKATCAVKSAKKDIEKELKNATTKNVDSEIEDDG